MALLEGEANNKYLFDLERSLTALSSRLLSDTKLELSKDYKLKPAYPDISRHIKKLSSDIRWMRRLDNEQNYHDNGGIYTETEIGENGFPEIGMHARLHSDKRFAEQHLQRAEDLEEVLGSYRKLLFDNSVSTEDESGLLAKIREEYRTRKYMEGIHNADLLDINSVSDNMEIIPYDNIQNLYRIVFAIPDKLKSIWAVYACDLEKEEIDISTKPLFGKKQTRKISHIYVDADGTKHISEDLLGILERDWSFGVAHLMWSLNKLPGIHPKMVSGVYISGFYFPGKPSMSETLTKMFMDHPDTFVMLSKRDYLVSTGQKEILGETKEEFSREDMKSDEFIVLPTELKQLQKQ